MSATGTERNGHELMSSSLDAHAHFRQKVKSSKDREQKQQSQHQLKHVQGSCEFQPTGVRDCPQGKAMKISPLLQPTKYILKSD